MLRQMDYEAINEHLERHAEFESGQSVFKKAAQRI